MSSRLQSLRDRMSLRSDEDDEGFSYFWDDIEQEASIAEVSLVNVQSTLSTNKVEIVLLISLLVSLISIFANLNGEVYLIAISALLSVLISMVLVLINSQYREPKRKMDYAIDKIIRMDFSENPEFIYMGELSGELEKIERIRSTLEKQQNTIKTNINSILAKSASSQQNLNFLVRDFNKVSSNLEKTIIGATNFQETRLFAGNVSREIDHFTQVFDRALSINEEVSTAIRTIGKQINMLALNAGIEAARAGEHGVGFDVVSSNLQQLSQHTVRTNNEMKSNRSSITEDATNTLSTITKSMNSLLDNIDKSNQVFSSLGNQVFDIRQRLNDLSSDLFGLISEVGGLSSATKSFGPEIDNESNT